MAADGHPLRDLRRVMAGALGRKPAPPGWPLRFHLFTRPRRTH